MRISDWSSDVCSSDLIESRISGGGDAQRKALSPPLAEAVGLVRDGKAPPDDFVARMNAADDGAPGSWRRLVQRDLASLIADALALWAEIRSLDAALDTGAPLSSALEARSEEHTSELQSLMRISYAVFCLKKKNTQ